MANKTAVISASSGYASLFDAVAGEMLANYNMIAMDGILTFDAARAADPGGAVSFGYFGADTDHYPRVVANSSYRHAGVWDANKYHLTTSGTSSAISSQTDYARFEYLQVEHAAPGAGRHSFDLVNGGNNTLIGCLIRGTVNLYADGSVFNNCIFTDPTYYGNIFASGAGTHRFINCVFVAGGDPNYAVYSYSAAALHFTNCYFTGSSDLFYSGDTSTHTFTSCKCSSSESATGLTPNVAFNTSLFQSVTPGNANYLKPQSGGALAGGTDMSANAKWYAGNVDVAGAARSAWYIGAFEGAGAAPSGVTGTGAVAASKPSASASGSQTVAGTCRVRTVGPGKDYANLNAALQGEYAANNSLTGLATENNVALKLRLYAFTDTTPVTSFPNFGLDATHRLEISVVAGERHGGEWDDAKYKLTSAGDTLFFQSDYVTFDGLQIQSTAVANDKHALRYDPFNDVSTDVRFLNCLIRADNCLSMYIEYLGGTFDNCLIYSGTQYGWRNGGGPTTYFENCTFVGYYYSFFVNYGTLVYKNCYGVTLGGGGTAFLDVSSGGAQHSFVTCATSGPQSAVGLQDNVAFNTDNFVSVTPWTPGFLRPQGSSALQGNGTNLSADPHWYLGSVDAAGATRPSLWSIGAFEPAMGTTGQLILSPQTLDFTIPSIRTSDGTEWAQNKPVAGTPRSLPTRMFPADNWWNIPVDAAPLDPDSNRFIYGTPALVSADGNDWNYRGFGVGPSYTATARYDWGNAYGFPFCTVSGNYPKVRFQGGTYWSQSDDVDYPIPVEALTEPGWTEDQEGTLSNPVSTGDRHLIIVDVDNQYLYEIYQPRYNATGAPIQMPNGEWLQPGNYYCASACFWDMKTNNVRPDGWTSSDAAGLQVLPGLVKYDEVMGPDPIQHAMRTYVAFSSAEQPHYVWPATHEAGAWLHDSLPMGARLRLKASFDLSRLDRWPHFKKIAQALKIYGAIVADNGGHGMISGTTDDRWGNYDSAIRAEMAEGSSQIKLTDYEVVQLGWTPSAPTAFAGTAAVVARKPSAAASGVMRIGGIASVTGVGAVGAARPSVAAIGGVTSRLGDAPILVSITGSIYDASTGQKRTTGRLLITPRTFIADGVSFVAPSTVIVNVPQSGDFSFTLASSNGVVYVVEFDPTPLDTSTPLHMKSGYFRNLWSVPENAIGMHQL